ncbi:uncharacterized protein LOC132189550 [Corylus avellana]|uniref:uncharacterized protein LOC132189550 n=1 Tax=Corylus avellana TaxID=13451 RepID=UPI00286B494C|nr:uncharacterized protein LOC132189550 [Corylus avellana]
MKKEHIIEKLLRERYYWDAELYATNIDGDKKVDCRACRKPILGAAFTYWGRYMFFHISCFNAPTNHKALFLHFGRRQHDPFIFTEEVKNDGKEDVNVVCFGCDKPVFGPRYKCSTSHCNLVLHQSCAELPPQIQYPFHPNHALALVKPKNKHCNACGKNCNAYPFYHCSECDFNLDFTCATTRSQIKINTDDCQHTFISLSKNFQFTCEACGEEGNEFASLCTICQLLIHTKCSQFSCIIIITSHDHSLTLIYSLSQVKEHNDIFCNLCYQKVKTKYGAYYCKECSYVVHLTCAFKYKEDAYLKLMREEFIDLQTNVMEVEGARQIRHFSHQHDLILSNEELMTNEPCDGCKGLIFTPFYSCIQCNFFLHSKCAQLSKNKRHPLHPHLLTLFSKSSFVLGSFSCKACQRLSNGFAYGCGMCGFYFDLQCCSIPETLKHEGHQHSLSLAVNSSRRCHVCNLTSDDKPCVFVCTNCDFALGFECATLPLVAGHKDDDHLLKLTYSVEAHCEEYYCLICEKERDPKQWFYYCAECNFSAHSECVLGKYPYIKFGSTFTSENKHEHPLTFVPKTKSSPPCDACDLDDNDDDEETSKSTNTVEIMMMQKL